jgi:phosphohistidine phosphatase
LAFDIPESLRDASGVKYLYLLRHAKSDWGNSSLPDHDRPLNKRGTHAADAMAGHFRDKDIRPELVLCSTALRAGETLEPVATVLGAASTVQIERKLYGASAEDLLDRVREVPDGVGSVLLIGHNPGMEGLALALAGTGRALDRIREKFPTAALATLEVPGTWRELQPGSAELTDFVVPRDLS